MLVTKFHQHVFMIYYQISACTELILTQYVSMNSYVSTGKIKLLKFSFSEFILGEIASFDASKLVTSPGMNSEKWPDFSKNANKVLDFLKIEIWKN